MELLKNRYIKLFALAVFVGAAAMCGAPNKETTETTDNNAVENVQQEPSVDEVQENATEMVSDPAPGAEQSADGVDQGLVMEVDACLELSRCTQAWGLQVLGVAIQVRADTLLQMSRETPNSDAWLTEQLRANQLLLQAEAAPLSEMFDGSAYQNQIASQRSLEIAALATALLMNREAKLPTGEATNVSELLDFSDALVQELLVEYPHLTVDTRETLQEAMPRPETAIQLAGGN